MKRKVFITALAIFALTFSILAQDDNTNDSHSLSMVIPEVALLDIEGGSTVTLTVDAPTEAGLALDFSDATNSSLWLNYSSIKSEANATRTVTAQISDGSVPDGVLLKVTAGADAGNGDGTKGSSSGQVLLNNNDAQTVITGIGSCYTGNGANNGHNLTYVLELDAGGDGYATLANATTDITIEYTISDN